MKNRLIAGIIAVVAGLVAIEWAGVGTCTLGQALAGQEDSWAEQRSDYGVELSIKVSPSTINLDSQSDGDSLTVHTDIAYFAVYVDTLALNGIAPLYAFADDRGCLVAKFDLDSIRPAIAPPDVVLTLTGYTVDGVFFEGSDTVRVLSPRA